MKKEEWGRSGAGLVSDRWPKDEAGRAEESAFLCTRSNTDMSDELTVNIDAVQMGVGGDNSWGDRPHGDDMVGKGEYGVSFLVEGL